MAEEPEVEVVAADAEPVVPEGRANVASNAFQTHMINYLCGLTAAAPAPTGVQKMCLIANTMPTSGNAPAATHPATGGTGTNITWVVATTGQGAATRADATVNFTGVPTGNYIGYAVFNASGAYLYSKAFTGGMIQVPGSATGNITVTATHTYDLN